MLERATESFLKGWRDRILDKGKKIPLLEVTVCTYVFEIFPPKFCVALLFFFIVKNTEQPLFS